MTVAPRPPVDVGPVTVQVREPGGTAPVAATTTTFARGYAYELAGVRGGLYELRAGTDRDGDGTICEAGDLCGAFPVAGAPVPVRVVGGMVAADRDFVLGRVTMEP
jgi:serine protease